jgi:predicted nucleic acid-binding protein
MGVEVVPIDRAPAAEAARLRARSRTLRLPDALSLAVARREGAELRTFDRKLARVASER